MLLREANDLISSTMRFNRDGLFLGTISSMVRSSTYFTLGPQVFTRSFTIIVNNIGPILVPWGIPPLRPNEVDTLLEILTYWDLPCKKEATQRMRHG